MDIRIKNSLVKLFYRTNERIGAIVEVKKSNKVRKKFKFLAFSISIEKPAVIQIYMVKSSDRREFSNKLLMNSQMLKVIDCHDVSEQPSYEIELETESKSWKVSAIRLEEKKWFISTFCKAVAVYQPQIFRELMLKNLPEGIELSKSTAEALDNAISDYWGDSPTAIDAAEASARGQRATDGYHTLTTREESDLRAFLNEEANGEDEGGFNADVLMDNLHNYLANAEGSNVHFIMDSEKKVSALLQALDGAVDELDNLESKLDSYHHYIADVEESMSGLQDSDQLAQTTADNRRILLDTLEHIVSKLSLNAGVLKTLEEGDLISSGDIERCKDAATSLDALLTSDRIKGEEHLQAVSEKSVELVVLRDKFARKLASQVNGMVLRFYDQLIRIAPGGGVTGSGAAGGAEKSHKHLGGGSSIMNLSSSRSTLFSSPTSANSSTAALKHCLELQVVQRVEMLQLSPLVGGWLQTNRCDMFRDLKKVYVDKMQVFFRRIIREIFLMGIQPIVGLTKSSRHESVKSDDFISVVSVAQGNTLNQFKPLFERIMMQLSSIVYGEENFIVEFFSMKNSSDEMNTFGCMKTLFASLPDEMNELIRLCEGQSLTFAMSMLLVLSTMADLLQTQSEAELSSGNPKTASNTSQTSSFWNELIIRCVAETKRVLKRLTDNMNQSFRESKCSKKARCGLLNIVKVYENFAESSILVFGTDGSRTLERSHSDLVCCLMTEVDRIADESVKTPTEVVLLENYHRIYDILCRLKLPSLDDTRKQAKARYQRALQEYSMNCMGRPLEDLHNFFEQVQRALDTGVRPEAICYQFAFQKHELQKIIKEYPGKEVKKGLESLRRKVEKNLSEDSNLFLVVWRSIQSEVTRQVLFYDDLIKRCYADSRLSLDFTIADLQGYFSEIANMPRRHALGDLRA